MHSGILLRLGPRAYFRSVAGLRLGPLRVARWRADGFGLNINVPYSRKFRANRLFNPVDCLRQLGRGQGGMKLDVQCEQDSLRSDMVNGRRAPARRRDLAEQVHRSGRA
jgi:hypothetical protein